MMPHFYTEVETPEWVAASGVVMECCDAPAVKLSECQDLLRNQHRPYALHCRNCGCIGFGHDPRAAFSRYAREAINRRANRRCACARPADIGAPLGQVLCGECGRLFVPAGNGP